jgi:peptide/nickel transport system permease protein
MQGAAAIGASDLRVIRRDLLPNVITVGIIFAMSDAVLTILLGGALSLLGLGVQAPDTRVGAHDRRRP